MVSEIQDFKNTKVIVLKDSPEDKYGFVFGMKKAKLILEHIEDIENFVNSDQKGVQL